MNNTRTPLGPSEYVSYLTALAALLNGYLGKDYGLSRNVQAMSILVAGIVVFGSGIARAIKHHGVTTANANIVVAQALASVPVPTSMGEPVADPYPGGVIPEVVAA